MKNPPVIADKGKTNRLSLPKNNLTMWGITNPTKAKMPLTETAAEVAKVANNKHTRKVLLTFIPKDEAYSSLTIMGFMSFDFMIKIVKAKKIKGTLE